MSHFKQKNVSTFCSVCKGQTFVCFSNFFHGKQKSAQVCTIQIICKICLPMGTSSAILEESGTKDSTSSPEDSFPGHCDGITNVTSNDGINAPIAIELLLST